MMRQFFNKWFMVLFFINTAVWAEGGDLFSVTATGALRLQKVNFSLCLNINGKKPLSCQDFSTESATLSILTTEPNHTYHYAGIKINTPGYVYIGGVGTGAGDYIYIGTVSDTQAVTGTVLSTTPFTVGGTVTNLINPLVLQNNGGDNETISSTDGSYTFSTPISEGNTYNVTILTQPNGQICTVANGTGTMGTANVSNVNVNCVTKNTTLSVSARGIIPVYSGTPGTPGIIRVTNNGKTYTAYNVSASIPGEWVGVTQNADNCAAIAPGDTCTLSFTATTPYLAQANITVSGDNITAPPSTILAFSMSDYLVFAIPSSSTALVVANNDAIGSPVRWSSNNSGNYDGGVAIYGISEISTPSSPNPATSQVASQTACNGATNGLCDTDNIYTYYQNYAIGFPIPTNYYAAGLCHQITADNSGSVPQGTWYLPAICQLGAFNGGMGGIDAGCGSRVANIEANLYNLGFLSNISSLLGYWSSTEDSFSADGGAWYQYFTFSGSSQSITNKFHQVGVRCVRAFTYNLP